MAHTKTMDQLRNGAAAQTAQGHDGDAWLANILDNADARDGDTVTIGPKCHAAVHAFHTAREARRAKDRAAADRAAAAAAIPRQTVPFGKYHPRGGGALNTEAHWPGFDDMLRRWAAEFPTAVVGADGVAFALPDYAEVARRLINVHSCRVCKYKEHDPDRLHTHQQQDHWCRFQGGTIEELAGPAVCPYPAVEGGSRLKPAGYIITADESRWWLGKLPVPEYVPPPAVVQLTVSAKPASPAAAVVEDWPTKGRRLWARAHSTRRWTRESFDAWSAEVTCGSCADKFRAYVQTNPPPVDDGEAMFAWFVHAHNTVNAHMVPAKPEVSVEQARAMWRPELGNVFGRSVVINLDRRPERLARFNGNVAKIAGGWPFAPIQRFAAVDGEKLTVPDGWNAGNGGYGCSLSHRAVLRQAVEDGVDSVLILEDDALFKPDFAEAARAFLAAVERVDPQWEMLMFGGQTLGGCPCRPVGDGTVAKSIGTNRFQCYAVRGPLIADLLARLERTLGHCDIEPWDMLRERRVYEPDPYWLVGQDEGWSDISGSQQGVRIWHKAPVKAEAVYLLAPRAVMEELAATGWHFGNHRHDDTGIDKWLAGLPGSNPDPANLSAAVRQFVEGIKGEAEAGGKVAATWHPTIDAGVMHAAMPEPWRPVVATTAAEARAALHERKP